MPADKDAAKRRRQARNRQERENRQARTEGAKRSASRPSRTAEERPTKSRGGAKGGPSLAKDDAAPAPAPGGFLGKLFPPRPDAGSDASSSARRRPPPSVIVELDDDVEATGARRFLLRSLAQPGGRAVVLAVFIAVVSAAVMLASPIWPVEVLTPVAEVSAEAAADVAGQDTTEAVQAFEDDTEPVYGKGSLSESIYPLPIGVALAVLPVMLALIAVSALTKPTRSRTLLWCAFGGVFVALFGGGGSFALPAAAAIGWGAWQSRKADQAAAADA